MNSNKTIHSFRIENISQICVLKNPPCIKHYLTYCKIENEVSALDKQLFRNDRIVLYIINYRDNITRFSNNSGGIVFQKHNPDTHL